MEINYLQKLLHDKELAFFGQFSQAEESALHTLTQHAAGGSQKTHSHTPGGYTHTTREHGTCCLKDAAVCVSVAERRCGGGREPAQIKC